MKRYFIYFIILFVFSVVIKAQTKEFEGYVEFKSEFVGEGENEQINMDMKYYIKGNNFRAELPAAEGTSILISDGKKTYMLMPEMKKY